MRKVLSLNLCKENQQSNGALSTQHLVGITSNNHLHAHRISLIKKYELLVNHKVGLVEFLNNFSNDDECLELYFSLHFSTCNCTKCGRNVLSNYIRINRKNKNGVPKKAFRCRSCHTHIYPLSNTIFRRSTIQLSKIFFIIFMLCGSSLSATGATKYISISYKTAHKLMMLIRTLLFNSNTKSKMKGNVEVDEAFIGKGSKVYNWSGICTRKQPIIGLVERETKQTRLFLVPNRSAATIDKLINDNVEHGSTIYTDSWKGYSNLFKYYTHEVIDHSSREFVRGNVHTNSIENVWSILKRNLRKVHIKISEKYVHLYLNEAAWRHNSRGKLPMQLFNEILVRSFFIFD